MSKQEACETNNVEIPGSHVTDIWQMQTFLTIVKQVPTSPSLGLYLLVEFS